MAKDRVNDGFDKFREEVGAGIVDDFLLKFGLGPNYLPHPAPTHECSCCHGKDAVVKEIHPDTEINEIVIQCPDCGCEKEV